MITGAAAGPLTNKDHFHILLGTAFYRQQLVSPIANRIEVLVNEAVTECEKAAALLRAELTETAKDKAEQSKWNKVQIVPLLEKMPKSNKKSENKV